LEGGIRAFGRKTAKEGREKRQKSSIRRSAEKGAFGKKKKNGVLEKKGVLIRGVAYCGGKKKKGNQTTSNFVSLPRELLQGEGKNSPTTIRLGKLARMKGTRRRSRKGSNLARPPSLIERTACRQEKRKEKFNNNTRRGVEAWHQNSCDEEKGMLEAVARLNKKRKRAETRAYCKPAKESRPLEGKKPLEKGGLDRLAKREKKKSDGDVFWKRAVGPREGKKKGRAARWIAVFKTTITRPKRGMAAFGEKEEKGQTHLLFQAEQKSSIFQKEKKDGPVRKAIGGRGGGVTLFVH